MVRYWPRTTWFSNIKNDRCNSKYIEIQFFGKQYYYGIRIVCVCDNNKCIYRLLNITVFIIFESISEQLCGSTVLTKFLISGHLLSHFGCQKSSFLRQKTTFFTNFDILIHINLMSSWYYCQIISIWCQFISIWCQWICQTMWKMT